MRVSESEAVLDCTEQSANVHVEWCDAIEPARGYTSYPFDDVPTEPMPVELLRDGRGIYGIGVSDLFDYEAVAWSCGVQPDLYHSQRPPSALILRPDRLMDYASR